MAAKGPQKLTKTVSKYWKNENYWRLQNVYKMVVGKYTGGWAANNLYNF
jgi:hypothetical protein